MNSNPRPVFAPRLRTAILALGLVTAQVAGTTVAFAQPKGAPVDNTKKALEVFKKAQALYKAGKYAEALPLFRESYGLTPSPNSQIYIARCLAGTGDHVGAYLEYNAIIADVDRRNDPKYQPARDSAVTERDESAAKIALLTVEVRNPTGETRLSIGGRDIPRESWSQALPFAPGPVDVTVITPPGAPKPQSVTLKAGDKQQISVDAAPAVTGGPQNPPPGGGGGSRAILRPVAYAAGGLGVAGFVMFGVAGGLATAAYSDLDSKCTKSSGKRVCPSNLQGQIDSGKLDQTLANVGLVVGAVGVAAGVTFFLLSREPKKEAAPQPQVQGVIGPSYLGLQGTF